MEGHVCSSLNSLPIGLVSWTMYPPAPPCGGSDDPILIAAALGTCCEEELRSKVNPIFLGLLFYSDKLSIVIPTSTSFSWKFIVPDSAPSVELITSDCPFR